MINAPYSFYGQADYGIISRAANSKKFPLGK